MTEMQYLFWFYVVLTWFWVRTPGVIIIFLVAAVFAGVADAPKENYWVFYFLTSLIAVPWMGGAALVGFVSGMKDG